MYYADTYFEAAKAHDARMSDSRRTTYQHGHLPAALAAAVVALVKERGVRGFSLAEAARRSGVSGSAPYRHYANRDALLAAVATHVYGVFAKRLRAAKKMHRAPLGQIAAMAAAYVAFARDDRARFAILFDSGIDKSKYPALTDAADAAYLEFTATVSVLCNRNASRTRDAATALRSCAHGYAALLNDGTLQHSGLPRKDIPRVAARSVRKLAKAFVPTER